VLQCGTPSDSDLLPPLAGVDCSVLHCVVVCRSVLHYVAVSCSVLQCVVVCRSVLHYVVVSCSVLQCVVVCSSVLHYVAVSCSVLQLRVGAVTPLNHTFAHSCVSDMSDLCVMSVTYVSHDSSICSTRPTHICNRTA